MIRVATDIGGTFTDIACYEHDEETGATSPVVSWKCDTVPEDLTAGVMATIDGVGLSPREIGFFAHGTTVVINTIAERKGAPKRANPVVRGNTAKAAPKASENLCRISHLHTAESPGFLMSGALRLRQ
jgi:hypothetical protein